MSKEVSNAEIIIRNKNKELAELRKKNEELRRELSRYDIITCTKCGSTYTKPIAHEKDARIEELEDKLDSIENWCVAYPQDMFIGEKFDLARHILKGIAELAELKSLEEK